ncbi:MAG: hypothetical protein IPM05_14740 [Propionivibrio sp.]|nr:hypothetical protein [Propionivibrio sp.]
MWLTGRLMPDFKTIADFRKDNVRPFVVSSPVRGAVPGAWPVLQSMVAIDGSWVQAVNNQDRNFTSAKLKRRMKEIRRASSRYLSDLDALIGGNLL